MSAGVAAFFDLDGTLVPEPSLEGRLFSSLRSNGAIPHLNYLLWCVEALRLFPGGLRRMRFANKRHLTGLNADYALQHLDSVTFFEEGIARAVWHAQQFHQIVLVTGTLQPLAQLAAGALECELEARGLAVRIHLLATQLAESRGVWTGRLVGEALYGAEKARAVVALGQARQWNLAQSHAYGNTPLDRDFLSAVGHAHAVNPGGELAALANREDWPIWHWYQGKKLASYASSSCTSEIPSLEGPA